MLRCCVSNAAYELRLDHFCWKRLDLLNISPAYCLNKKYTIMIKIGHEWDFALMRLGLDLQ